MNFKEKMKYSYTIQASRHCYVPMGFALLWTVYAITAHYWDEPNAVFATVMAFCTWAVYFLVLLLWRKVKINDAEKTMNILGTE